jgi:alpha-ketoglutarate-dependent taurine dioxygenase
VSEKHGDKARFAKQRQNKILRRKRLREVSKAVSLENKTKAIPAEPKQGEDNSAMLNGRADHIVLNAPPQL